MGGAFPGLPGSRRSRGTPRRRGQGSCPRLPAPLPACSQIADLSAGKAWSGPPTRSPPPPGHSRAGPPGAGPESRPRPGGGPRLWGRRSRAPPRGCQPRSAATPRALCLRLRARGRGAGRAPLGPALRRLGPAPGAPFRRGSRGGVGPLPSPVPAYPPPCRDYPPSFWRCSCLPPRPPLLAVPLAHTSAPLSHLPRTCPFRGAPPPTPAPLTFLPVAPRPLQVFPPSLWHFEFVRF